MTDPAYIAFLIAGVFLLALGMNLVRKNTTLVMLYLLQSLLVAASLVALSGTEHAEGLFFAGILTFAIKAVMAPGFLLSLIRRYSAHFSETSYLSLPLILIALAAITAFSYYLVAPSFAGEGQGVALLIASIFTAMFLMVNRRGALAAVVGVLALENGIVLLASTLGVTHSIGLEFAIAFDIALWIAIASGFLTMMYRQFGTLEAQSTMTKLTEE